MPILPTRHAWDRVRGAVRRDEAELNAMGLGREGRPGGHGGIHVRVKGGPVVVTTTTGTTGTTPFVFTTTTTSTTTTTDCPRSTTTAGPTTTTTPGPRYLYPGKFVYRNVDALDGKEWWHEGEDCWVQEDHNEGLGRNCVYPGNVAGEYMGQVIVGVRGGDNLPCEQGTATLTTGGNDCVGYCVWTLDVASGNWVKSSSTCCPSSTCDCPQPDFCPPFGATCGNTITYCDPASDESPVVNCPSSTTTTTGGGTTTSLTTTTTTPDPTSCGLGCGCKYVPGLGLVLTYFDCNTAALAGGCYCTGTCGCHADPNTPCTTFSAPCDVICPPPPPPPYCRGTCFWVSDGQFWHQIGGSCDSFNSPCVCYPPSQQGACASQQTTSCRVPPGDTTTVGPGGTTTLGPTTTTLRGTTTTAGGCKDTCLLQWNTGASRWDKVSSCGSSCDCADPGYSGTDNCSYAVVPCTGTTTSSSTTTTNTGTTTTGTTVTTTTSLTTSSTTPQYCCGLGASCVWQCGFVGYTTDPNTGQQVALYEWAACRNNCLGTCNPPNLGPCSASNAGACATGFCNAPGDCGTNQCKDANGDCVDCTTTGMDAVGNPVYRCADCTQVVSNLDSPRLGVTGVF